MQDAGTSWHWGHATLKGRDVVCDLKTLSSNGGAIRDRTQMHRSGSQACVVSKGLQNGRLHPSWIKHLAKRPVPPEPGIGCGLPIGSGTSGYSCHLTTSVTFFEFPSAEDRLCCAASSSATTPSSFLMQYISVRSITRLAMSHNGKECSVKLLRCNSWFFTAHVDENPLRQVVMIWRRGRDTSPFEMRQLSRSGSALEVRPGNASQRCVRAHVTKPRLFMVTSCRTGLLEFIARDRPCLNSPK